MTSKKFHTAMLLLALLSASASVSAQTSNTGLSREAVNADLLAWQQAGLDQLYREDSGPDMSSPEYLQAYERYLQLRLGSDYRAPSPLTREQVQADLANWKKAGMEEFSRSNSTPSFESPAYRQAYEKYLRLTEAQSYQGSSNGLNRSEVQADWQAWQSAGLARLWQSNQSPDTSSPAYQRALQEYQRLRQNR